MIDTTMQAFLTDFADTPNIPNALPGSPNTLMNNSTTDDANSLNVRIDQNFGTKTMLWALPQPLYNCLKSSALRRKTSCESIAHQGMGHHGHGLPCIVGLVQSPTSVQVQQGSCNTYGCSARLGVPPHKTPEAGVWGVEHACQVGGIFNKLCLPNTLDHGIGGLGVPMV